MTNQRFWLAGGVVLVALGFLLVRGLGDAAVYFRTTDEALAQRESLGTRRFRLEGTVVPGSVRSTDRDVAFSISGKDAKIEVVHEGDPPELFRPGMPVVLEGHFSGEHFSSDRIMVKHSEEYVADHPERVTTVPAGAVVPPALTGPVPPALPGRSGPSGPGP